MILDRFRKMKENIIKIKLISIIILNILKLRDMQYKKDSTIMIDKLDTVKNFSKLFYDLLSFNIYSLLLNSISNYKRIKECYKYIMREE